jgi:hypothetical protein
MRPSTKKLFYYFSISNKLKNNKTIYMTLTFRVINGVMLIIITNKHLV